jgi:hypothetical protein
MIARQKTGREKPQDQGADKIDRHEYEPTEERGRKKAVAFPAGQLKRSMDGENGLVTFLVEAGSEPNFLDTNLIYSSSIIRLILGQTSPPLVFIRSIYARFSHCLIALS